VLSQLIRHSRSTVVEEAPTQVKTYPQCLRITHMGNIRRMETGEEDVKAYINLVIK
jgi:hypothetical protein